MVRILFELGYVVKDQSTDVLLSDRDKWNSGFLSIVAKNKTKLIQLINKGLKESQLTGNTFE